MRTLTFCVTDWVWCTSESELHCAGESVERAGRPLSTLNLPATERRRLNPLASFALRAGERLVGARTTEELRSVPMVFGSAEGDGVVLLRLLSALREHQPVSPTQFHNSVHNAPTGYWSIGLASQAATTALAAGEDTVAVALVEAGLQAIIRRGPVVMLAASRAFPPELRPARPDVHDFALAAWCEPAENRTGWQCEVSRSSMSSAAEPGSIEAAMRARGVQGLVGSRAVRHLAAALEITQVTR